MILVTVLAACGPSEAAHRESGSSDEPPSGASSAAGAGLDAAHRDAIEAATLPPGMTVAHIERGAVVFDGRGNCHICHGPDGKGARGVGADLTDDEWWHGDGSWEAIVATIRSGVAQADARNDWGAIMPPRGGTTIDDADVRAAAAYVWSLRLRPAPRPPEPGS